MSDLQRTLILEKIRARGEAYYGPGGSAGNYFRKVVKGPLQPAENYPVLRISDNGQSRFEGGDAPESEERILKLRIYAMLDENWERTSVLEDWSDRIEQLIHRYSNWLPEGCGLIRMKYQADDPFDVIFTSGKTAAVWVIDFEAHYFVEVHEPEDWE